MGNLKPAGEDRYLPAGTWVKFDWFDDDGNHNPEYFVVIKCWWNEEIHAHDCWVASFGSNLPSEANKKPVVFRYATVSMTEIEHT